MRVGHQPGNNPELTNSKKGGRGAPAGAASAAASGDTKRVEKDTASELSEVQEASGKRANLDVKADISSKSKEFSNAKAVASNAPDVRADKIAELKRRIADKSYKVDHVAVADKMVDEHLRMPDKD